MTKLAGGSEQQGNTGGAGGGNERSQQAGGEGGEKKTEGGSGDDKKTEGGEEGDSASKGGAEFDPNKSLLSDEPEGGDGGDKKREGDDKEGDDKGDKRAPEKYELNMPEGMQADEAELGKYTDFAREAGLTNEQAQAAIDYYFKNIDEAQAKLDAQYQQQRLGWRDEISKDPVLGGSEGRAQVAKALSLDAEFAKMVKESWMGDNPTIHRFLHKIGGMVKEDTPPGGTGSGGGRKSLASLIYDKS